jgi:3-phosphoshikimate 1-carboxyvinyltransferase
LYIANSGTSVRFLTALVACGEGLFTLDGTPRMRERPIHDLLESLRQLGVDARDPRQTGCPPVEISAHGLPGGRATVRGDVSSQFLSGLLLAAPYALEPLTLAVAGELVSQTYILTTLAVMEAFGVQVPRRELMEFTVPQARYQARDYYIEPDASAASYWFAAAAITRGKITVAGLNRASLQGDVAFVDCLQQMGCEVMEDARGITVRGGELRGIDINMNTLSDTVQTLTAVALFAQGPTRIRGIAHNRHKETDRIGNLAIELRKLGAEVEEFSDGLKVTPSELRGSRIATYQDHRMAMSLSLAGLRVPGVVIEDPSCVEKTYPEFFSDLEKLTGTR